MATVQRPPAPIKAQDASEWPGWTDDDTYGLSDPAEWPAWTDQVRPELPPAADDDEYFASIARVGYAGDCPDPATCLPAADWMEARAAWHRFQHDECDPLGAQRLVAGVLSTAARGLRGQHAAGILASDPGRISVPDRAAYGGRLALEIASEAALLYPYDSAIKRIAARALVNLSIEVERLGSPTAQDYIIDEAAWRAAAVDAICQGVTF